MKSGIKNTVVILLLSIPFIGFAQLQLNLRNAIDTALRNNYDIRIAKNNVEISRISNTYGMAGGLPTVSATAAENGSITTVNQNLGGGTKSNISDKAQNALNADVSAGMVLFNGFRIMATKERLSRLQNLSEIQLNRQIQSTIADVMVTFYDIIRQQNYLKIIQNSLDVSKQKLEIINMKNTVGMASAVDLLQAQTDVNSAEQQLETQKLVIEQAKSDLLLVMGAKKPMSFVVLDSIGIDSSLKSDSIMGLLKQNPQLMGAEQQVRIDELTVKEVGTQRYPTIRMSAGYDFYNANANKGTPLYNQSFGPSAGLTMQVPIFNGNVNKTQHEVAKIKANNSMLEKENLMNTLSTQVTKVYRSYSTVISQISAQQKNVEMTRQLVDVVMQKFHVNQSTILDVKAAQTSYENAAYTLINLQYSAKVAEIGLKELSYSLKY